ncbi:MAG TPA: hypothetical protein VML75_06930 [Kofleriaceae bacterium]|nr:hypothetical protein [Kofleriaceae bacterium]
MRSSSSALGLVLLFGACVEELPPITGTTSLQVTLSAPADTGSFADRLPDAARAVTFSIQALDADGIPDPIDATIDLYTHFLGSLTPKLELGTPLATINLVGGRVENVTLDLPRAYGPTFLWAEHTRGEQPSYATGTSPTLWFRDPFIEDVQRPPDEMSLDALERSPLEEKQINITGSRYGDVGRLVITGVYAQGYTVSDVQCQDAAGTPPCVTGDYDHMFVFTFSRPEDTEHHGLAKGHVVTSLKGSVSEFNGLTEVNFPRTEIAAPEPTPGLLPEPTVLQASWLQTRIEMERIEAGLVAVDDATLCPLDEEFDTFKQWKLDVGLGCRNSINIISAGQVPDFDAAAHVGEVLPRVVGTLRPINIGSFHVWILYPRELADITTPAN